MSRNLGYYVKYFSELPKEWRTIRLDKNVVDILPGYAFKSYFFEEFKGTPLIRVRDVGKDKTEICYNGDFDRKYIVQKNDILIGMDGEYLVSRWNGPKALLNQRVCRIESLDENFIDNDYLFYVVKKPIKKIEIQTPQTTVKHLSTKDIRKIRVPLPPLPEQHKIASILSTVDDAIEKTDEVIGKAEMLKRGLMQSLLTRGIGHIKFRKTKLGEIPEPWKIKKLEDLIKIRSGNYFKYSEFVPKGIKVLKIDNVSFGEISWENKSFLPISYVKKFPDLTLEKNSIVIALNRPVINGKLKLGILNDVDIPSILYQRVGKLVNQKKSELLDFYLYYVMSSSFFIKEIKRISIGTDQPYINPTELVKLKIRIPPISEQIKIVSILREIDALIQKEKYSKKLLKELKNGLMQVLLKGKVRVKVD